MSVAPALARWLALVSLWLAASLSPLALWPHGYTWLCGCMATWLHGSVARYLSCCMAAWLAAFLALWLWLCGKLLVWLHGDVACYKSGVVAPCLAVCLALWLCGSVALSQPAAWSLLRLILLPLRCFHGPAPWEGAAPGARKQPPLQLPTLASGLEFAHPRAQAP